MIRLKTSANVEPKFYRVSAPLVEIKAVKADPLMFDPGTKKMHEIAEQKAREIAAQDGFAAFSFKTNDKGRQELYVDGKKLFEAKEFELISTYDYWKRTTCWIFIVKDRIQGRDAYGLYGLSIYTDKNTGKKAIEAGLDIPIEYSYMAPVSNGEYAVKCTTFSGAAKYFGWNGRPIVAK
jgi:hypothetical protein